MSLFNKKNINDESQINVKRVNEVISLSKKVLNAIYVILIAVGIYLVTRLSKEWKIFDFILTILRVVSPLFIGLVTAWLLNPVVKWFKDRGLKRIWGSIITYVILIGIIALFLGTLIPLFSNQINDFAASIPGIFKIIESWANDIFNTLEGIGALDVEAIKNDFYSSVSNIGTNLTTELPAMTVTFVKGLLSSVTNILVGLIIGFYISISFENPDGVIAVLPKNMRELTKEILDEMEKSLRNFVTGALLDALFVFFISSLCLWLVGLKAPLLFGFFCGLTNMIPYAGPYIGGIPAVIVGFSQNPTTGLFTLAVLAIIQTLEGNFIQPLIMSKTTSLHPVTIILGLLIFGHFWGIIGMFISTPVIACVKALALLLNKKYDIIKIEE